MAMEVSADRLRRGVEALPTPRSRLHWPDAMSRTDDLILTAFEENGWKAQRRPYELTNALGYLDYPGGAFLAGSKSTVYPYLAGVNILGIKEGEDSTDAVVVGAHHDTIRDTAGADDNGAGVAALIELARVLAPYRFRKSIVLAALDMEEIGFLGAKALIPELSKERKIIGATHLRDHGLLRKHTQHPVHTTRARFPMQRSNTEDQTSPVSRRLDFGSVSWSLHLPRTDIRRGARPRGWPRRNYTGS